MSDNTRQSAETAEIDETAETTDPTKTDDSALGKLRWEEDAPEVPSDRPDAESAREKGYRPRYDQAGKGYAGGRDETASWSQTPPAQRDEVRLEEDAAAKKDAG